MININTAIKIKTVLKGLTDEKSSFKALNSLSILSPNLILSLLSVHVLELLTLSYKMLNEIFSGKSFQKHKLKGK